MRELRLASLLALVTASGPLSAADVPIVVSRTTNFMAHDLAVDGAEMLSGSFTPASARVIVDVQAAYSFLGNARAALLLYVAQPDDVGSRLYDSGGKPLHGARWYSVGSVNGESAWAATTYRRLVLDVDPAKDVTWQLLGGIIGGAGTVDVPGPRHLAIIPNGTKAFVTSPRQGMVTPIILGRPGYSFDQNHKPSDVGAAPIPTGASPTHISADNVHVIVSNLDATEDHLSILSVATHAVLRRVSIPGGSPLGSAITADGTCAVVGTASGRVARVRLATGETKILETGGRIAGVGVLQDGQAALVADSQGGNVYRIALADMTLDATIAVGDAPYVVRIAPDGQAWVLCRPAPPAKGRLKRIDLAAGAVASDYVLPFESPNDVAIVPVAGQTSQFVRTAWVVYEGGRYSQFYIGGPFAGKAHSFHTASFGKNLDAASGVAINDFGEIWVAQPELNRVWKWPGGRLICRADASGLAGGVFFGEYCEVLVYGAKQKQAQKEPRQ